MVHRLLQAGRKMVLLRSAAVLLALALAPKPWLTCRGQQQQMHVRHSVMRFKPLFDVFCNLQQDFQLQGWSHANGFRPQPLSSAQVVRC